ncbi:MAG: amidohydrolase family protein [Acidobacteria bacterium]|nr:amidohydrolase family protein [Acidobacteriota bacterium]
MIDAHHHLWNYSVEEYGWISETMGVLRRDFLPADLKRHMDAAGVVGAVAVQARQTLEETEWLLSHARRNDFMLGVVGWAPFAEAGVARHIERFAAEPKLKGFRHVVQDEPDDRFLLGAAFNEGIRELLPSGLVYDVLIYERHLPVAIEFVDAHPRQVFVLDHIAKPRIREGAVSPWRENLRELARRPNVYCKVSGMATEADWGAWSADGLQPYFDVALETFTPRRLMFGSDWPVLEVAGSYERWAATVRGWLAPLSTSEQQRILQGTAMEAYRL